VPTSGFARAFCADSTGRLAQKHDGTPTAVVDGLCDRSAPTRVSRDPNALSR
jgi:hypothetical protein